MKLSDDECRELEQIVRTGRQKAQVRERAQILLWSGSGKSDLDIAGLLHRTPLTIAQTRKRWATDHTLSDLPKRGRDKRLDGKQEALLVALACSDAPEGRESRTMQLLADRLVELKVIETPISDETVRRILKKKELKSWLKEHWCIPAVGSEFVWRMADVLDVYAQPLDPAYPQVCFDERPVQFLGDIYLPLPAQPGQKRRIDYEYKRHGTANLFVLCQPLAAKSK